jgi:hypothetical protein
MLGLFSYPENGSSRFFQKLVTIYWTTQYHIPKYSNFIGTATRTPNLNIVQLICPY